MLTAAERKRPQGPIGMLLLRTPDKQAVYLLDEGDALSVAIAIDMVAAYLTKGGFDVADRIFAPTTILRCWEWMQLCEREPWRRPVGWLLRLHRNGARIKGRRHTVAIFRRSYMDVVEC